MSSSDALRERFCEAFPEAGAPQLVTIPQVVTVLGDRLPHLGLHALVLSGAAGRPFAVAVKEEAGLSVRIGDVPAIEAGGQPLASGGEFSAGLQQAWQALGHALGARDVGAAFLFDDFEGAHDAALVDGANAAALAWLALAEDRPSSGLLPALHGEFPAASLETLAAAAGEAGLLEVDGLTVEARQLPQLDDVEWYAAEGPGAITDCPPQALGEPALRDALHARINQQLAETFGEEIHVAALGELWRGHLCLTHQEAQELIDAAWPNRTTPIAERAARGTERAAARWAADEYERLERARDALLTADPEAFGRCMYESTAALRPYCCTALLRAADVAQAAGALGFRPTLTGPPGHATVLAEQARRGGIERAFKQAGWQLRTFSA